MRYLLFILLFANVALAATESVSSTGAAATDGSEIDWINVNNVKVCDGSLFTSVTLVPSSNSSNLVGSSITFTPSIPSNATIIGIEFELPRYLDLLASGILSTEFAWVLYENGANLRSYRIATISIDDGDNQYIDGDCAGMLGYTLTPAILNSATFGFKFQFANTDTKFDLEPGVDCVTLHICWTTPASNAGAKLLKGVGQ